VGEGCGGKLSVMLSQGTARPHPHPHPHPRHTAVWMVSAQRCLHSWVASALWLILCVTQCQSAGCCMLKSQAATCCVANPLFVICAGAIAIAGCILRKSAHVSARAPTPVVRSHQEALLLPSLSLLTERLFKRFDEKSTGNIDYEEFLNGGCVVVQACSPTGPMWGQNPPCLAFLSWSLLRWEYFPLALRNSRLFLVRMRCIVSLVAVLFLYEQRARLVRCIAGHVVLMSITFALCSRRFARHGRLLQGQPR
jgi:hypothetical protein